MYRLTANYICVNFKPLFFSPKVAKKLLQQNLSILIDKKNNFSSLIEDKKIRVHYVTKNNEKITVYGKEGDNVMHLAQQNDINIEGACEASLACCTCHVYVRQDFYEKLSAPTEEEEDLLDMAPFLKPNSRLSCQIILSPNIHEIEVMLPQATRNFYVDGKKPSHH